MALSATVLGNLIITDLEALGYSSNTISNISNGVAKGIIDYMIGAQFLTTDTGIGKGGSGSGTGIFGLPGIGIVHWTLYTINITVDDSSIIGPNAVEFMNIIAKNYTIVMQSATLTATDPDVGSGTGTIRGGSFALNSLELASSINNNMPHGQFFGLKNSIYFKARPLFCSGLARGIIGGLQKYSQASITITGGSGSSPSTGMGVVTIS